LVRKGIDFVAGTVAGVAPERNALTLDDGRTLEYDYLVLGTGPELAFDEIPGLGPDAHSVSICTLEHAERAFEAYQRFLDAPGPGLRGLPALARRPRAGRRRRRAGSERRRSGVRVRADPRRRSSKAEAPPQGADHLREERAV